MKILRNFFLICMISLLSSQARATVGSSGPLLEAATDVFSQPGVRFMQKLRTQVDGAKIAVRGLPEGLSFNNRRCLVEGIIADEGTYTYDVVVTVDTVEHIVPVNLTVSSSLAQPTPFMGWLSWNVVQSDISTDVVKAVADAMVRTGLKDAGYTYLVIDDLWQAPTRTDEGYPREDAAKFPGGMKEAADYTHSKGLKFGIYSDAAEHTCGGAFGSLGYESQDARQYAEWGVDLLKYDYCEAPDDVDTARVRYKAMSDALKATGRDIVFYICEWGQRQPWLWGAEAGGSCWRTTYDTRDCWHGDEESHGIGVLESIKNIKNLWPYNGVNRWNDADMMCVGIHGTGKSSSDLCISPAGMTPDEYATQFALWCMWSSPLTLSFDLSKDISPEDLALITNAELIALNQDPMGQAAQPIFDDDNFIVFAKDLANGDVAVSVTNLTDSEAPFTVDLSKIDALEAATLYDVRDVVNHTDNSAVSSYAGLEIPAINAHGTAVRRLHRSAPHE